MSDDIEQAEPSGQDYVPDTQDEKRRMFALAVVVQQSEPTRVSPEEFVTMAHRVATWLRDGVDTPKPAALSAIEGGKKK